jgi:transcriptional regulator with XRE-family HTH domain
LVFCTNPVIVIQSLFWEKFTMNGAQVRMARAALKMNLRELAAEAEVSPNTITRIEADMPSNASTMAAIRSVFEARGVEFIPENGGGVGMRLPKEASAESGPAPAPGKPRSRRS